LKTKGWEVRNSQYTMGNNEKITGLLFDSKRKLAKPVKAVTKNC